MGDGAGPDYRRIAEAVGAHGLVARGGFHPEAPDGVPALADGRPTRTLIIIGSVGGSAWPSFALSRERSDGSADPLDRWTRRILLAIAREFDAAALFPFGGPPHLPFQRWAQRAEPVAPSPLGILIHPDHGLWHAYRGALAFARQLDLPARGDRPRACDACTTKPCLSACPVGAFADLGYNVARCIDHVVAPAGQACRSGGCRARLACPVGRHLAHDEAQARFHMDAFVAARQRSLRR